MKRCINYCIIAKKLKATNFIHSVLSVTPIFGPTNLLIPFEIFFLYNIALKSHLLTHNYIVNAISLTCQSMARVTNDGLVTFERIVPFYYSTLQAS